MTRTTNTSDTNPVAAVAGDDVGIARAQALLLELAELLGRSAARRIMRDEQSAAVDTGCQDGVVPEGKAG